MMFWLEGLPLWAPLALAVASLGLKLTMPWWWPEESDSKKSDKKVDSET